MSYTITLDENSAEKILDSNALKKACLTYAKENFQGKRFLNKKTHREILVSRDGLDEWQSKSKSREQILSIKRLDEMLTEADLLDTGGDTEDRYDINEYAYFSQPIAVSKKLFQAIITIRNTKQSGDKYYHHYLKDITLKPLSGNWHTSDTSASNAPLLNGFGGVVIPESTTPQL
jgi:hypothetical protein